MSKREPEEIRQMTDKDYNDLRRVLGVFTKDRGYRPCDAMLACATLAVELHFYCSGREFPSPAGAEHLEKVLRTIMGEHAALVAVFADPHCQRN